MKYPLIITALFVGNLFAMNVANAELDRAMQEMCAKMKICSTAEINRQGLPEELVTMVTAMFDGMCKTWMKPYANTLGKAGLEDKAEACIDSMVAVSCEVIMESEGSFQSKECVEFERAADESGVDLENLAE